MAFSGIPGAAQGVEYPRRDLPCIGVAGFQGDARLTLHHRYLGTLLRESPCRCHADDPTTQNSNFHDQISNVLTNIDVMDI